ncbi:MAG: type II secretion system F family protein, partial [Candidatus Anstonellales archaeon]
YGELSKEFSAASNQIRAGMSVSSALSDMAERNSSKLLERVNFLMLHGYKSGGEVRRALREGAENVFLFLSLLRERASLLAVQKYTIIIGGGVLVPLILGSVLSMANSLDIGKTNFLGRESSLGGAEIKNALPLANRIYLVICCLFSSLMVGHIEGDKSKFFPYFLLMAASSLFLFSFAMDANPLKVGF